MRPAIVLIIFVTCKFIYCGDSNRSYRVSPMLWHGCASPVITASSNRPCLWYPVHLSRHDNRVLVDLLLVWSWFPALYKIPAL